MSVLAINPRLGRATNISPTSPVWNVSADIRGSREVLNEAVPNSACGLPPCAIRAFGSINSSAPFNEPWNRGISTSEVAMPATIFSCLAPDCTKPSRSASSDRSGSLPSLRVKSASARFLITGSVFLNMSTVTLTPLLRALPMNGTKPIASMAASTYLASRRLLVTLYAS